MIPALSLHTFRLRRGYMLLEVVLALSIFSVAVVGLLSSLNAALDADYEQRRLTHTRLHLQSMVDHTLAENLQTGEQSFEMDIYKVAYHRSVEPATVRLDANRSLDGFLKVTFQALDTTRGDRVIETFTIHVYRP